MFKKSIPLLFGARLAIERWEVGFVGVPLANRVRFGRKQP